MQVVPGSAAAHAGIQGGNQRVYYGNYEIIIGGDLIVEIDGQEVKDHAGSGASHEQPSFR